MQTAPHATEKLCDADLIAELTRLVACERKATSRVLRRLIEFDARRLYLAEGYSSLFAYCTQALHYAEHAALNRIEVARAARRLPCLLAHIEAGTLNITGARLLVPHLTTENANSLVAAARHKSKREIEEMIASLRPKPAVPPMVRRLPSPRQATSEATNLTPSAESSAVTGRSCSQAAVAPTVAVRPAMVALSPERYKVQFTITRETRDRLHQVQDLMRHSNPNADPAVIFDRGLTLLLDDLQRKRFAATQKPREQSEDATASRHIPANVKRAVWQRDQGRCAFVGTRGVCGERGFLEFHHVVPFAAGGPATVPNIELRCRAHNAYEASLFFGEASGVVRERCERGGADYNKAPEPGLY